MSGRSRRSGGLLVELVMASALFILITQVFFSLNQQKMRAVQMAEDQTVATLAADGRIDRLRNLTADALDAADGTAFAVAGLDAETDEPGRIAVAAVDGHPGLRRVTVTIEWRGRVGRREQRVEMTAIVRPAAGS